MLRRNFSEKESNQGLMNKEQQENISDESMYYNDDFEHISGNYYQTEQNISTQEYYSEYKSRKQKSYKKFQKISKKWKIYRRRH